MMKEGTLVKMQNSMSSDPTYIVTHVSTFRFRHPKRVRIKAVEFVERKTLFGRAKHEAKAVGEDIVVTEHDIRGLTLLEKQDIIKNIKGGKK